MIHVRHAAAAIAAGVCETVLITMAKAAAPVSGAPVMSSRRRASRGNSSSPIGQWAADFVHDPGLALHDFSVAPAKAGAAAIAVEYGSASGPISARSANATARSARKRASCIFRPLDRFKLLCGEGELTTYRFNTGTAQHTFCRHCGIHAFYMPRSEPDQISVNARCLDDIDVSVLKPSRFFDGRNWEAAFAVRQAFGS